VNEPVDMYCGGCGSPLSRLETRETWTPLASPHVVEDLRELFQTGTVASPDDDLPSANITQGDLDKLFGR